MDPIIDYRARTGSVTISQFMSRVYGWMTFGLLITAVVAYVVGHDLALLRMVAGATGILIFFQLGLVLVLSFGIRRMSVGAATFCFLLYAFSVGLTFSVIFQIYVQESIAEVFAITAASFGGLALYGVTTKRDLSGMGSFLFIALLGGILAMVVNIFLHSAALQFFVSVGMVLVFAGLTAYDNQRIRSYAAMGDTESDAAHKMAIMGALALYLDFINIFIYLLQFFGRRRD